MRQHLQSDVVLSVPPGSEMGARVRAFDWASTSLGRIERWSTSMRTVVGTVLGSRFPMVVWWGPELLHIYNDPYAQMLGGKHPQALGRPAPEVWSEIWHIVGPLAESVRAGGPATWSEHLLLPIQRRGYLEETYFTFSYSPVHDGREVTAILVTCQETTSHVTGERQMRTLQQLAAVAASRPDVESALSASAKVLAGNDADLPFALLYLRDDPPRLAASAGVPDDAAPLLDPSAWPLAEAGERGAPVVVEDLASRFASIPRGRWSVPPCRALCLPLPRAGSARPWGYLVTGLSPLRALDPSYAGFLGLAADHIGAAVGSARAWQEERRRSEALAELDRAKTVFFSNVSHELRTPLTLMLGPIEDLAAGRPEPLPEALRPGVDVLQRNARRLLRLVNSLLDFARIEGGRVQPATEAIDLAAYTTDVAGVFRAAVERAGLQLVVDAPPLSGPVQIDPEWWEKILLNLLSNAFKFTFAGRIEVVLRELNDGVQLTVRDTGTGIPAAELPRLFQRFHRVPSARARTQEGTGIGLAMVHELTRLMGGSVEVESGEGEGSTFRVTVPQGAVSSIAPVPSRTPRHLDWADEAMRLLEPDHVQPEAPTRTDACVLAVDDNADMREYLRRILGERWQVLLAADGETALEIARRERPDLVLTDVMMPGLDGFELLRELRADLATRHIPVIMLTARAGEEAGVDGLSAGADDYLVKPFSVRELVARVQAQLTVATSRRELEIQRAILYELFLHAPAPICVFAGEDLVFEMANESFERLLGGRDLLGLPFADALPELAELEYPETLRRVMRTREAFVARELHLRISRRPGSAPEDAWFSVAFAALPGRDTSDRVMVFAQDVTDQVLARRAAEGSSRAKDEFLAMLGHELRNPLSPILTALQLMRLRYPETSAREREVIERQVHHLVRLVDDLLDVSRITRGKIEMHNRPFALEDAVTRALEQASPLLEQRRHRLEVDVKPGLVVRGDVDRMAQVISNLLTNAAKYTEPGGHVSVRASAEAGSVLLRVADDGNGIEPEILPSLFDQFVQGRQSLDRSPGGLGLGLTIVRSLTRMHGGDVSVHSDGPGRGSEFVIRLPAWNGGLGMPGPARAPARRFAGRVLIVDDNTDAAEMLADVLEDDGFEVRATHDGPHALAIAREFRPEVALLDLGLPVMDGFELARRLRELDEIAGIGLVAVTGYGQPGDRERTRAAGFDDHLVKPVDLDAVLPALERLIARSRAAGAPPAQVRASMDPG